MDGFDSFSEISSIKAEVIRRQAKLLSKEPIALVPYGFRADEYYQLVPLPTKNPLEMRDAFHFILTLLSRESFLPNFKASHSFQIPVAVSTRLLKMVLGNRYALYLNTLINNDVIIPVSRYRPGKPRKFILGKAFFEQKMVYRTYQHQRIRCRVKESFRKTFQGKKRLFTAYAPLIYWLWNEGLEIDKDGALLYYKGFLNRFVELAQSRKGPDYIQKIKSSVPLRISRLNSVIGKVQAHDHFPSIDANARLYTLWPLMPEPIRNFITFNGKSLCTIDIKNSQPFHLCYLFTPEFWGSKEYATALISLDKWLYQTLEKENILEKIRQHVKAVQNAKDVILFREKTISGQYYESLVEKYADQHPELATRAKAKLNFLRFLNFDLRRKNQKRYAAYRTWAKDFPNVAALLELIKEVNHPFISKILQQLEAKILLQKTAAAFAKKFPSTPIGSIHDSLITLHDKQEELMLITKKVYKKFLGITPNLDIKVLNPQNAYADMDKYLLRKLNSSN